MSGKVIVDIEAADRKIAGSIDYSRTAFFMKRPHSNSIAAGPYQIRDKREHKLLVSVAIKKGLYLWYSAVQQREDKTFFAMSMMVVDWDTVPSQKGEQPVAPVVSAKVDDASPEEKATLRCPCGKICSSTSGFTLHRARCSVAQSAI